MKSAPSFSQFLERKLLQVQDLTALDGTCAKAHKREAPTDTTELPKQLTWFTLQGFKPATLGSAA